MNKGAFRTDTTFFTQMFALIGVIDAQIQCIMHQNIPIAQ